MFTGWLGLPGHWKVLIYRISQGEGLLGLFGVDQRSSRMSSRGLSESWPVLSAVLMILTCHSVNPLDLRKWGEMWSDLCDGAKGIV